MEVLKPGLNGHTDLGDPAQLVEYEDPAPQEVEIPLKPAQFRHIWWRQIWRQEVIIGHPRFEIWLREWARCGPEEPIGSLMAEFGLSGWTADDLIRQYLDELYIANLCNRPLRYGSTTWPELRKTIAQMEELGNALCVEGRRLSGIARSLRNAEKSALAASRVNAVLGQPRFHVPCTCGLRRELERYARLFMEAGIDDRIRATELGTILNG